MSDIDEQTVDFLERAAIMEFDGGLPRAKAENEARKLLGLHDEENPKCPLNAKPFPEGPCRCRSSSYPRRRKLERPA